MVALSQKTDCSRNHDHAYRDIAVCDVALPSNHARLSQDKSGETGGEQGKAKIADREKAIANLFWGTSTHRTPRTAG